MTETEPPCEKKSTPENPNPCAVPPTDAISKIMDTYNKMDAGEITVEDAGVKITDILKTQRQKKIDCLKNLGVKV